MIDRVGNLYPAGMSKWDWLTYCAHEFDACEVNSTFYALPKPSGSEAMTDTFVFANNHWRGQAIGAIRQLRTMLD